MLRVEFSPKAACSQHGHFSRRRPGSDAELGEVFFVALEEFHHGQVLLLNLVLSRLHVFGVIIGSANDWASCARADAKLPGRRLVIRVAKAVPDARTIREMTDEGHTGVLRRPDRLDHSGSEGQLADEAFGG